MICAQKRLTIRPARGYRIDADPTEEGAQQTRSLTLSSQRLRRPDAAYAQRGDRKQECRDGKAPGGRGIGNQQTTECRAGESADPLERAGRHVGRDQLFGRSRERGHQRHMGRPMQDPEECIQRRNRVHHQRRETRDDGERCEAHQTGASEVDSQQDPMSREPIGDRREGRREERRRQGAGKAENADGHDAAGLVGVDPERHEPRPLSRIAEHPRHLGASDVRVGEDAPEGIRCGGEAADHLCARIRREARSPSRPP